MEKLIGRLRMAQVASCSCLTKTAVIEYHTEDCLYRILEEAARAIEQASQPQVPEGYKLVPTEPTKAMEDAVMAEAHKQFGHGITRAAVEIMHRAMVAAAPDLNQQ